MNQSKWAKRVMVSGLAVAMLAGSASAALADGNGKGHGDHEDKAKGHDKGKVEIKLTFKDMEAAEWARKYIASLATRHVFEGYNDGTFKPQRIVTRIEAITAAVKLMGLNDQAQAEMNTELHFKDANQVEKKYAWAVGYVAVALENDLFSENDTMIQPDKPADRLWATTLLVKALKLDDEAKAKMNTDLKFRDAHQIPAGSVGYVAEAVDKNLIAGYSDNTFRPNRPITRAELAVLLDKTGSQMPGEEASAIEGTVSAAVNANVLTLTKDGKAVQLPIDPNAFIFRAGAKVTADKLVVGDQVLVRTYNNVVVFVEVKKPAETTAELTGTVSAAVYNNTLNVTANGQTQAYALSSQALIVRNNAIVPASALKAGDAIKFRIVNNQVVFVQVTKAADESAVFTATVASAVTNNTLKLTRNGQAVEYPLAAGVIIQRNGALVGANALLAGDEAVVRVDNSQVTLVQVVKTAEFTVSGTLNMITINAQGKIASISVSNGGQVFIYNVASNVTITGDASKLVPNQPIELKGSDQTVTSIIVK